MRSTDTAHTAEVLSRIEPDHWSVSVHDGEPVLGITVAGAADYVQSHKDQPVGIPDVLDILGRLLPADLWADLLDELTDRGELIANV